MMGPWIKYETRLKSRLSVHLKEDDEDLRFWQDHLFINFLVYCFPVSLLAVIPGIFMAVKDGYPIITTVDLLSLSLIIFLTFSKKLPLQKRKLFLICTFYGLSVVLINNLGYIGPGIFYLFTITILAALIFPIRFAYWSIVANTLLLLTFALIIQFRLFNSALIHDYTMGKWIAFSSNLVFVSIVLVVLIRRIFERMRSMILNKDDLQKRYRTIFDRSPLPMWLFDTETLGFLEVNEAAIRHYGYTREEFSGMTIKQIRQAEDVAGVESLVKANQVSGRFFNGTFKHLKKDGSIIDVKIESNLIKVGNRQARLVLSTDITAQLKNELEICMANLKIKQSEMNLRAIFDSAIEGFILLDEFCFIKTLNSKARDYIKFNTVKKEFEIGKSIFDFIELPRQGHFREMIAKVHSGKIIEYDRKYHDENKVSYWVHYTLTPVYENNSISGVCITGRDITAGKNYVRTIEAQNKAFREISWMQSHMVRAPLARILGLIQLLITPLDKYDRNEMLKYLELSANELDDIIKKITYNSHDILKQHPDAGSELWESERESVE